ncbi:Fc.00g045140.m01.CDS01 [Cosmosporella sp. VM-42]
MAPDAASLKSLNALVDTASALLQQLQNILGDIQRNPTATSTSEPSSSPPIDILAVARDSASLIRAHSTKISLLIINEPFTPSAVASVVRELVQGPIPGLASAIQICDTTRYTAVLRKELAFRAQSVLSELNGLLQRVPRDGRVLSGDQKTGFGSRGKNKGSLASTGVLWSACDDVVKLANMGVGGFFVKKVEEWRDTLKDVMEEMKEWGEEEPDDEDDEDEDDDDDDGVDDLVDQMGGSHISTQEMLDDLMNSHQTIPRSDPDGIRPKLESSLRRVRLVALLYQAITKRRLKKMPHLPPADATSKLPQQLDDLAKTLEQLPDKFGDLAAAFYELKPKEIDASMDSCFGEALTVSEVLSNSWDGSRDEFTDWVEKFQVEVKKG